MQSVSLALFLQLGVIAAPAPVTDEALAAFVRQENPLGVWLSETITHDPKMRAEMKRVRFASACTALAESRTLIAARHRERLVPITVNSVKHHVPADRLNEMKILSLWVGPMQIYKARILDQVRRDGAEIVAEAESEMRSAFLTQTAKMNSVEGESANIVLPKADIAKALGIADGYNLDNPAHIMLACAEQRIAPDQRPTITTGP